MDAFTLILLGLAVLGRGAAAALAHKLRPRRKRELDADAAK